MRKEVREYLAKKQAEKKDKLERKFIIYGIISGLIILASMYFGVAP